MNWESIPESPVMTLTHPEQMKEEFNIEEICSKILKLQNLEDLYLFLSFNGGLQNLSLDTDIKRIESCIRICEQLEEKNYNFANKDSKAIVKNINESQALELQFHT